MEKFVDGSSSGQTVECYGREKRKPRVVEGRLGEMTGAREMKTE